MKPPTQLTDAEAGCAQKHTVGQLYSLTGGKLDLHLHPGQAEAWDSEARFTFIYAGTQSGKTSYLPWWQWREIMRTIRPGEPNDFIAATATYDLFKLKLLPVMRTVWEDVFQRGRYWPAAQIMELCDDTGKFWANRADDTMYARIVLRSASSRGGLESLTGKNAILDECGMDEFELEAWQAVLRRLSLYQGRVLGGTTLYNLGWTYSEVYQRWRDGDPDFRVVQFDSITNPSFPQAEYERAKRTMSPDKFDMFYRGQFARPAGMVYGCVQEHHWVDDFHIPRDWPIYVGIDPGGANTAKVWAARNPETGIYFLFKEMLDGDRPTATHAEDVLKRQDNLVGVWGGSESETQERANYRHSGLTVHAPPISSVEVGISNVTAMFMDDQIRIFKSCKGLRDEIGTYRRKVGQDGQVMEEIVDKRVYHRLDALRYMVNGIRARRVAQVA